MKERLMDGTFLGAAAPPNEGEFSPRFASTLVVVQSFVSLAGQSH